MKERILFLVLLVLCVGCSSYNGISDNSLIGSFYGISKGQIQGLNTRYTLELKEDNLFILSIKGHGYRPRCTGDWEYRDDSLILKCSDIETVAEKLSNGYMNQREFNVKVKSKNRLRLDNIILKR